MTARRRAAPLGLVGVLLVALLAGCSGIPDSGKVVKVDPERNDAQSATRFAPVGPAPGDSPRQIVRGFVEAMLAYPVSSGTAASFLTPEAAKRWRPTDRTVVYSRIEVGSAADSGDERRLDVSLDHMAHLDEQGTFTALDTSERVDLTLEEVKGEWRISTPPDGTWVSERYFNDYFRPYDLFYFDTSGERLAALPVYQVAGDRMPTDLVRSLLVGPRGALEGQARSFLPPETTLRGAVTQDDDGLVEIQLRQSLADLTNAEQERAAAQLVWTMRQVTGVTGVRITAANTVFDPGGRDAQSLDAWSEFAPRSARGSFYALGSDHVVRLIDGAAKAIAGPWGKDARGATRIAINAAEDTIAAVVDDSDAVVVSKLAASGDDTDLTIDGTGFTAPLWDPRGGLWLVDRPSDTSRLRIVTKGEARDVSMGALGLLRVTDIALSPDGARFAAIADSNTADNTVYTGPVLRNAKGEVIGLGSLDRLTNADFALATPRAVSWDLTTDLSIIAQTGASGPQVYAVRIDGSRVSGGGADGEPLLPTPDPITFVTGGSAQSAMYVADGDGSMWFLRPRGSWQRIDDADLSAPIYTG